MSQDTQKIIDEYSAEYCSFLEAAYGHSMMSEGGESAIEDLLEGIDLEVLKKLIKTSLKDLDKIYQIKM